MTSSYPTATHSPSEVSDVMEKLFEREWFQQLVSECIFFATEPKIERFFEEYFAKCEEDSAFSPDEKILLKDQGGLWLYEIKVEMGTAEEAADAFIAWHKFHEEKGLPNALEMVPQAGRMRGIASWILGDAERAAQILTEGAGKGDPLCFALLKAIGAPVPRVDPSFLNISSTIGTWDAEEFRDALVFFYQGDYDAAIALCETRESGIYGAAAEMFMGYCLLMKGEPEKALQIFEGRMSWEFVEEEVLFGRALVCRMLGLPVSVSDNCSNEDKVIIRMISLI